MDEMIRVLVAECDRDMRETYCAEFSGRSFAIFSTGQGDQAISMIESLLPDVVFLSLVLPRKDGLGILEDLGKRVIRRYPYIVAATRMESRVQQQATGLGADVVLQKPVDIDALCAILSDSREKASQLALRHARMRVELATCQLREIGMSEGLKGFGYLARAVALVSADDQLLRHATGKLYPQLAAECGVSDHSVERAIRHAIETTWTHGSVEAIHRVFGNSIDPQRGKPTNTECIAMLAEQLWEKLKVEGVYE